MEPSQNLAIESFSFSWLTNKKLCLDSINEQPFRKSFEFFDENSPEEAKKTPQSSIFDFPSSKCHNNIAHADEIFSHGLILPSLKYTERTNKKVFTTSYSVPSSPTPSFLRRNHSPNNRVRISFFRNWRKTSKKILQRYFSFFKTPCDEVGCARRNVKVDGFNGKYRAAKSLNNSPRFSPSSEKPNFAENWSEIKRGTRKIKSMSNTPNGSPPRLQSYSRSDLCIDDAILHCKKSFDK